MRIHQGYGMGEGITTFTRIDDPPAVILGTQGRPISDADELVIDGPGGEPGEILEKALILSSATKETAIPGLFHRGWFLPHR